MPEFAPTQERLLTLVEAMENQPVAMLVDLVVDRYVTGTPKRISREAPVLILRHEGERYVPGGGANAVANVIALGGQPAVVGVVGDDSNGSALLDALRARGASVDGILIRPGFRTPTKTRILAGARHAIKQQVVRVDIEDHVDLSPNEQRQLLARLADAKGSRAAVLSDYGYGTVQPTLLGAVRDTLGPTCPIVGDSRYRLASFQGLDGATPNLEEAEALLGHPVEDAPDQVASAARALRAALGTRHLLITRGSDGMALVSGDTVSGDTVAPDPEAGGDVAILPVHGTDQVADVTGAGDTVIGAYALALAAGASALEAACLANYAGGVVVMKTGTATLDRDELATAIRTDAAPLEALTWVRSSDG